MKQNLLAMVQTILSSMNSDEVNSIDDTVEARQVAEEIRTAYNELFNNRELGCFEGLINLEYIDGDPANVLRIPDGVTHIKWVKYLNTYHHSNQVQEGLFAPETLPPSETETIVNGNIVSSQYNRYLKVEYVDPEEFVNTVFDRTPGTFEPTEEVEFLPTSPFKYVIQINQSPRHYTVFDDKQRLVFDSYNSFVEDHLTGSSAIAWGIRTKEFIMQDDFVPDLDENLFPQLLAEAKSVCFSNIKEMPNQKEEQKARRQLVRSQKYITRTGEAKGNWADPINYGRNR